MHRFWKARNCDRFFLIPQHF